MKDLNYYKNNCEEDYIKTPISVLRYITELEKNNETKQLTLHIVSQQRELLIEAFDLINVHDGDIKKIAKLVDITLKSINCG